MDENMNNPTPKPEDQPQQESPTPESRPEPTPSQPEPTPQQPEQTPQQPEAQATEASPVQDELSSDSKNMAMLCHLLGLFTNFIGPLILWLIKKDEDKFVDSQGKEALNFQITVALAGIVSGILSFVCIGFLLAIAVSICDLVFSILACVAASRGEDYRYPFSIRLVK